MMETINIFKSKKAKKVESAEEKRNLTHKYGMKLYSKNHSG